MSSPTHHQRVMERLRAAMAALEATRAQLAAATAQHLVDHPDPVPPATTTTEEA